MKLNLAVRYGTTRTAVLAFGWAFKIPTCTEWRLFLYGLLSNLQEARWSRSGWPELCPVLWSVPGGFLLIMKRARPLSREEFDALDLESWIDRGKYLIPAEIKMDSFGYLEGRLVAIDYGEQT